VIVLITIHGIGFQRAPSQPGASDGFADALHEGLRSSFAGVLGDDPIRVAAGGRGPVYAQSNSPPHTGPTEPGLNRLGTWTTTGSVEITGKPLAGAGADIAHVALVYSGLEEQTGDVPALIGMEVIGAGSITSYTTLGGLVQMAFRDLAALRQHPKVSGDPSSSLEPRTDVATHRGIVDRLMDKQPVAAGPPPDAHSSTILRVIEDDVAAYVTRNEHRERVRGFLRDATSRILARPDVSGVVINGHSNGTVMGFDLIAALSPPSARRVRALVTSGSPLRKYVDLLDWGRDAGNMWAMTGPWANFWDIADPVADPLAPPAGWKRGDQIPDGGGPGMFFVRDPGTGIESDRKTRDIPVDNVADSKGTGLRAHNYWDNPTFCAKTAEILKQVPA
jgi:hypothetical protein